MGSWRVLVTGAALWFVVACIHTEGARSMESRTARLGESFSLPVSESARVEDAEITIAFEEVSSDSRCPKDVNCIQAGEAVILLAVESAAGSKALLEFRVPPGGGGPASTFEAFQVEVLELRPEKESTKSIDPAAYVAIVRVSRT